jgi:thiol:disulfide interchange protein DsbD
LQQVSGAQVGWGFQFQYPGYVIALATLVFAFGLSLLGVFEVPVIGANRAHAAGDKEGWLGHFMQGVFVTLLATPCTAPFLGTGMGFAFTLPSWGVILFFGIAGLGLAFPLLAIAFVPALFRFLPRPGAWMEIFERLMGFALMATTIWLVDVVGAQTGPDGLVGLLAFLMVVAMGCWIFGHWGGVTATSRQNLGSLAAAVGLSALAGFLFLTTELAPTADCDDGSVAAELDFGEEIPWQPFSEGRVEALAGQTVFVDFTADWCLTCKTNEQAVLETVKVRSVMSELGVVPLKADWTRRDETITKWLQRFGRAGVPFYLVLPADTSAEPLPLPEVITPDIVVKALREGAGS